jgi:Zn finger protein HypA/HybF involved in hydrogenase expression
MAKTEKITVVCNECGKKRKVAANTNSDLICPKCGGADFDVAEE